MKTCFVCIGSNYNRKGNLLLAQQRLRALFPTIRFAPEEETEPLHVKNRAMFSNQVAMFATEREEEGVLDALKAIERQSGRLPGDKEKEIISLDIDLLMYDGEILKPEDMKLEYVRRGMNQLNNY